MDSTLLLALSQQVTGPRDDLSIPPSRNFIVKATVRSLGLTRRPASTGPQMWHKFVFAVSFEFCDEGILMVLAALLRPELSSE